MMLKAFLDVVRLFLYIEEPVRLVSNFSFVEVEIEIES